MELIQSIDFSVLDFIREHLNCRFLDIFLGIFTTLGNGGIVWIVLTVGLLISKRYRRLGCVMAIGLAFCLLTGNLFLKLLIARDRPFIVNPDIGIFIPLGPFIFVIHIGSDNGKIQPQACRSSNSRSCTDSIFKAVFLRAFPHRCAGRHADGHNFRTGYI